jgi:hypothetical protein
MSYTIRDINDYKGDFATLAGLEELREYAAKRDLFHISGFLEKGAALMTEVLVEEVKSAKPASKTLRATLENLSDILDRSELVAIIQDGVND